MTEHPFPPLFDENSHTLILGSFPSVKSREQGFFYGHPQNRFWRVLAQIYGEAVPDGIAEKRALILGRGLALWDVLARCDINGSADSSIRRAGPHSRKILQKIRRAPLGAGGRAPLDQSGQRRMDAAAPCRGVEGHSRLIFSHFIFLPQKR